MYADKYMYARMLSPVENTKLVTSGNFDKLLPADYSNNIRCTIPQPSCFLSTEMLRLNFTYLSGSPLTAMGSDNIRSTSKGDDRARASHHPARHQHHFYFLT